MVHLRFLKLPEWKNWEPSADASLPHSNFGQKVGEDQQNRTHMQKNRRNREVEPPFH
jgi:hypothetical protein